MEPPSTIDLDLTDMATVDAAQLGARLRGAEVIFALYPDGDHTLLKGETLLQSIVANGSTQSVPVLGLRVANDRQAAIVVSALRLDELGELDEGGVAHLWTLLADVNQRCQEPPSASTATRYTDAATRGALRAWKQKLARGYRRFERGCNATHRDVVGDFLRKSGTGRRRAFGKLVHGFGPAVTLECLRLDGNFPLAVWSILKPREAVRVGENDAAMGQPGVCVNYVLAGETPTGSGAIEGLWTIEVSDHALGRLIERPASHGTAGLEAVIIEAHHNLLLLRADQVIPDNELKGERSFLLRAGAGGFICQISVGYDTSAGNKPFLHVQAVTWISDDQIHADQVPLVPDGTPGTRLIDGWLLPMPARLIVPYDGKLMLTTAVVGLPDLLAAAKGRA